MWNLIELRKDDYELISYILGDFICDNIYITSILDGKGSVFVENINICSRDYN